MTDYITQYDKATKQVLDLAKKIDRDFLPLYDLEYPLTDIVKVLRDKYKDPKFRKKYVGDMQFNGKVPYAKGFCALTTICVYNLYGGGSAGMQQLIDTMLYDITSQKISQNCLDTLTDYVHSMCAVPSSDTLHSYPYACRVYAPGERQYATNWQCQKQAVNKRQQQAYGDVVKPAEEFYQEDKRSGYTCQSNAIKYIRCNQNAYLEDCTKEENEYCTDFGAEKNNNNCGKISAGNSCLPCEPGYTIDDTCSDYVGSMYQSVVRYAIQSCMRPSESEATSGNDTPISDEVLQAVNATMDSVRSEMSAVLKTECERLGGYWVATPYQETAINNTNASNLDIWPRFYNETGANKKWGYCADPIAAENYYGNVAPTP